MNNELAPQNAGFDVVHTDASGLLYIEMPYDIPLESNFAEIEDFETALGSRCPDQQLGQVQLPRGQPHPPAPLRTGGTRTRRMSRMSREPESQQPKGAEQPR